MPQDITEESLVYIYCVCACVYKLAGKYYILLFVDMYFVHLEQIQFKIQNISVYKSMKVKLCRKR